MNKVVAIDPGTGHTGLCVYDGNVTITVTIEPKPTVVGFNKLVSIARTISKYIEPEDFVVMEDYGYGGTFFNAQIAELVALIKFKIFLKKSNSMMIIAPNTVKKLITGNGRASKTVLLKEVLQRAKDAGVTFNTKHESDAYALTLCYFQYRAKSLSSDMLRALKARIIAFRR